jgi:hypothetical protein
MAKPRLARINSLIFAIIAEPPSNGIDSKFRPETAISSLLRFPIDYLSIRFTFLVILSEVNEDNMEIF